MSETLHIGKDADKETQYRELLPQLEALVAGETDVIANTANIVAALKQTFGFLWVGVYFVRKDRLVLGPFQGPVACTGIGYGKGVCGTAWKEKRTLVVDDVQSFPGHIACSPEARSEIVVPVMKGDGEVVMVLDADSNREGGFDATDEAFLNRIAQIIAARI